MQLLNFYDVWRLLEFLLFFVFLKLVVFCFLPLYVGVYLEFAMGFKSWVFGLVPVLVAPVLVAVPVSVAQANPSPTPVT